MTAVVSRTAAGLRAPRSSTPLTTATGVTAHYGGDSPWGRGVDRSSATRFEATTDHNRCASIWRAWQAYHMSPGWGGTVNGGADIAYNLGVCPHDRVFMGRGPRVRSGAQGTAAGNRSSLAIVYIAGGSDPLTNGAKRAFLHGARMLGLPLRWNHGDWKATACAGPNIRAWQRLGWPEPGGAPSPDPTPTPAPKPKPGELTMADAQDILDALKAQDVKVQQIREWSLISLAEGRKRADALQKLLELGLIGVYEGRLHAEADAARAAEIQAAIEALEPSAELAQLTAEVHALAALTD